MQLINKGKQVEVELELICSFNSSLVLCTVIIEKLLRTTEAKRIYVLIRPKQGQDVQQRIAAWKEDAVSPFRLLPLAVPHLQLQLMLFYSSLDLCTALEIQCQCLAAHCAHCG